MTTAAIIVALGLLVVLLAIKMPVALSLGLSGAVGLLMLEGFGYTTNVLGSTPFSTTATFSLTIIPMFVLMGMFAVRARVAEHVFAIAARVARRAPGGLGVATIMASAGFSAVSGSSIGTAATMSKLSVAEMRAHGYPASLAAGLVAVAGTLGVMIPPSTFLVLYAIMTQQSVAQMLAAGIIPGILSAVAYAAYIMVAGHRRIGRSTDPDDLDSAVARARVELSSRRLGSTRRGGASATAERPTAGRAPATTAPPPAPSAPALAPGEQTPWRKLPWRGVVYIAILFVIVLGGMYSGFFTSTESAAIGALAALIILVVEQRKSGLKGIVASFRGALQDTSSTTAMVFLIVIGSGILSTFFIAARVPQAITGFVADLGMPAMLTMALLLICLVPLGMVLESLSILVITVPILFPIAIELGFDGIWLGILIVKLIEIGMITPPVGINVFVVAGATKVNTATVFKGVLPLFLVDLVVTAVLFLFPQIVLFLPSLVAAGAG
ncbi:MAG: TRAP transporter large permease [Pseudoclavibacter sp.]